MKLTIIDDFFPLLKILKKTQLISDDNLTMVQAYNCKEAIELFSSFNPEIVILDIELPDGSGLDLLKKLKKDCPDVKVIMFTNHTAGDFRERCLELGANHFFNKSNLKGLIQTIHKYSNNLNIN